MFTCTSVCLLHFTTLTLPSMHSTLLYNMYCHSNFCRKVYKYVQLHIFRIICIGYSDFLTLCLKHYAYMYWSILFVLAKEHSMSLPLPVALYCSMHFRRHGAGSRSGSGLWLSDGWYVGLPYRVSACMRGWTVDGVQMCNLLRRLNSAVSFTYTA